MPVTHGVAGSSPVQTALKSIALQECKAFLFMSYFVYILKSQKDDSLYKGFTTDYIRRLEEHNSGMGRYTSKKMPWSLIYVEECESKSQALKREKSLKRANSEYIKWLIQQPTNILNQE